MEIKNTVSERLLMVLNINLVWSILICFVISNFTLMSIYQSSLLQNKYLPYIFFSLAYCGISQIARTSKPWAIGICILIAFLSMIRWLPMVILNLGMFIGRHPLYLDSPATIFIVAIYACLFAFPPTALSIMYFAFRKELLQVFFERDYFKA